MDRDVHLEVECRSSQVGPKLRTSFAIGAVTRLLNDLPHMPLDELDSDFEVYQKLEEISSCRGVNIAGICPIREWGPFRIQRDFSNSSFDNLEFRGTDFSGSTFRRATFSDIGAYQVSLNEVDARYSVWLRSAISESSIQSATFARADLSGCDLSGCNLSNSSFLNVRAVATNFRGACLHNCDFSFSDIRDAQFSEAQLRNTDFSYALHVSREHLPPIDVELANFWGITVTNGYEPLDWPRKPPSLKKRVLAVLRSAGLWG